MESPVFGFLATLADLNEGIKAPKPLNSALLPLAKAVVISLIIISNTLSASLTVILLSSENLIIRSDFFNSIPYLSSFLSSFLSSLIISFSSFCSFFLSVVFADFASSAAPKISPKDAPESAEP